MSGSKKDNNTEQFKALAPDARVETTIAPDGSKHAPLDKAELSYKWFTSEGVYPPRAGIKVNHLICGKKTFAAIHKAIEKATKSVDIIIWGFDPGMRFNPDESDKSIGELLEEKGRAGVNCRVLVWYDRLASIKEPTVIGNDHTQKDNKYVYYKETDHEVESEVEDNYYPYPSGIYYYISDLSDPVKKQKKLNQFLEERDKLKTDIANYEARLDAGERIPSKDTRKYRADLKDLKKVEKKITSYEKDVSGYGSGSGGGGGPFLDPDAQKMARHWIRKVEKHQMTNVELKTRNFTNAQENRILKAVNQNKAETGTNWKMNRLFGNFPSHHQKVILIDYEDPANATGFVMGHNIHRAYWDTEEHYFYEEDANRVQGFGPWQDISTQVWGEILYDINENFVTAWNREKPIEQELEERRQLPSSAFKVDGTKNVQFCRTQPQIVLSETGDYDRSILAIYKKAIDNAHNYIYMENQYFRYSDYAKRIINRAQSLKEAREAHGKESPPLYLFVLTNTPNDKSFSSTTYNMMSELGQQQLMPEAQRTLYIREDAKARRKANPPGRHGGYTWQVNDYSIDEEVISAKDQERIKEVRTKSDIEKMSEEGEGWDIEGKDGKKPFELDEVDGLKVIVGVLTTDSSVTNSNRNFTQGAKNSIPTHQSQYTRYRGIYIHSKLLIVDDLFTFIGSTNINARSYWVDSESGIAIPDPDFAYDLRHQLWNSHVKASVENSNLNASTAIRCNAHENFNYWDRKMNSNWKLKAKGKPLECQITRFWDVETPYASAVD